MAALAALLLVSGAAWRGAAAASAQPATTPSVVTTPLTRSVASARDSYADVVKVVAIHPTLDLSLFEIDPVPLDGDRSVLPVDPDGDGYEDIAWWACAGIGVPVGAVLARLAVLTLRVLGRRIARRPGKSEVAME